ncbi:hypothetical protein FUAX_39520 (plasmid) [Fulvitalea axinellae]|uniref:Outer membrane protein beta-barrel domain-containing protein n=1 Tax=Fulvitalea axinellae TaxID=1182444 RepID=A0AAU9DG56_9BACT|nr:hypothetical protein FUAX_39520 [Fulvitalea axinellae]
MRFVLFTFLLGAILCHSGYSQGFLRGGSIDLDIRGAALDQGIPQEVFWGGLGTRLGATLPANEKLYIAPGFVLNSFWKSKGDNLTEEVLLYGPELSMKVKVLENTFYEGTKLFLSTKGSFLWAYNALVPDRDEDCYFWDVDDVPLYFCECDNDCDDNRDSETLMRRHGFALGAGMEFYFYEWLSVSANYVFRPVTFRIDENTMSSLKKDGKAFGKKHRFDFSTFELTVSFHLPFAEL